jgi:hypothetical protein
MPRSTIAYPFEYKVFDWLNRLSSWARPGEPQTFLLALTHQGEVIRLLFECPTAGWHEELEVLKQRNQPFIFFDPFDYPEYAYFQWFKIDKVTMERLMGAAFQESDFAGGGRKEDTGYPETWGVMY